MKKNRGFSLIELIVLIGIAGVLAGSSVLALNYLKYADTKKCANEIDSMLDKVRVLSMTKGSTSLYIYMYDGRCYMKVSNGALVRDSNGTLLSKGDIEITGIEEVTGVEKTVSDTTTLTITFSRSNGALLKDPADSKTYTRIRIKSNSREYIIRIIKLTGKHYIE